LPNEKDTRINEVVESEGFGPSLRRDEGLIEEAPEMVLLRAHMHEIDDTIRRIDQRRAERVLHTRERDGFLEEICALDERAVELYASAQDSQATRTYWASTGGRDMASSVNAARRDIDRVRTSLRQAGNARDAGRATSASATAAAEFSTPTTHTPTTSTPATSPTAAWVSLAATQPLNWEQERRQEGDDEEFVGSGDEALPQFLHDRHPDVFGSDWSPS
jgi:hypothetical protein